MQNLLKISPLFKAITYVHLLIIKSTQVVTKGKKGYYFIKKAVTFSVKPTKRTAGTNGFGFVASVSLRKEVDSKSTPMPGDGGSGGFIWQLMVCNKLGSHSG